jgi:hypothetical protein
MSKVICVFCENIYSEGVMVCQECNEYKGLMPIEQAKETYDFLNLEDEE